MFWGANEAARMSAGMRQQRLQIEAICWLPSAECFLAPSQRIIQRRCVVFTDCTRFDAAGFFAEPCVSALRVALQRNVNRVSWHGCCQMWRQPRLGCGNRIIWILQKSLCIQMAQPVRAGVSRKVVNHRHLRVPDQRSQLHWMRLNRINAASMKPYGIGIQTCQHRQPRRSSLTNFFRAGQQKRRKITVQQYAATASSRAQKIARCAKERITWFVEGCQFASESSIRQCGCGFEQLMPDCGAVVSFKQHRTGARHSRVQRKFAQDSGHSRILQAARKQCGAAESSVQYESLRCGCRRGRTGYACIVGGVDLWQNRSQHVDHFGKRISNRWALMQPLTLDKNGVFQKVVVSVQKKQRGLARIKAETKPMRVAYQRS